MRDTIIPSGGDELFVIRKEDSLIIDSVLFDNEDLIIYPNLISNESYSRILDVTINSTFGPMTSDLADDALTLRSDNVASTRSVDDSRLLPERYAPVACGDPDVLI